jgi:hypothetical protein
VELDRRAVSDLLALKGYGEDVDVGSVVGVFSVAGGAVGQMCGGGRGRRPVGGGWYVGIGDRLDIGERLPAVRRARCACWFRSELLVHVHRDWF